MGIVLENDFAVPAPAPTVWTYFTEVPRVVPCMPGATLTEVIDDDNFEGEVALKLGPISLAFAGTVEVTERDDERLHLELKARGTEQRGKGSASAIVTVRVEPDGEESSVVRFQQDISITGSVAQFSRGLLQDMSTRLTKQFADCLKVNIMAMQSGTTVKIPGGGGPANESAAADAPAHSRQIPSTSRELPRAKPIHGFRLAVWALGRAIRRTILRLLGRARRD